MMAANLSAPAAFFDVDGTLVRGHMLLPMMRLFYRWGYLTRGQVAKSIWRRSLHAIGRIRQNDIDRMWAETLAFLQGKRQEEFTRLMRRAFEEVAPKVVRPAAPAMIAEHRRQGHRVYLATSQTVETARPLAERLCLDGIIGTELETRDGRYTGRFVRGYCYGERKAGEVERFAAANGVDLAQSWFYTDAEVDVPLLKLVGHPVAVNPERKLAKVARVRGWPVLVFG
jgi:HAD superfamily hydrolase (TIGR01490 family)